MQPHGKEGNAPIAILPGDSIFGAFMSPHTFTLYLKLPLRGVSLQSMSSPVLQLHLLHIPSMIYQLLLFSARGSFPTVSPSPPRAAAAPSQGQPEPAGACLGLAERDNFCHHHFHKKTSLFSCLQAGEGISHPSAGAVPSDFRSDFSPSVPSARGCLLMKALTLESWRNPGGVMQLNFKF